MKPWASEHTCVKNSCTKLKTKFYNRYWWWQQWCWKLALWAIKALSDLVSLYSSSSAIVRSLGFVMWSFSNFSNVRTLTAVYRDHVVSRLQYASIVRCSPCGQQYFYFAVESWQEGQWLLHISNAFIIVLNYHLSINYPSTVFDLPSLCLLSTQFSL